MRSLTKFEAVVNVALLLAAVSVLFTVAEGQWRRTASSRVRNAGQFLKGSRIDLPPSPGLRKSSVVLAISSECGYCTKSMPFYRSLARIRDSVGKFRLVAVGGQPADLLARYLEQNEVVPDQVVSRNLRDMGINGTPTLLVVDSKGTVVEAWSGLLDSLTEKQVEASLSRIRAD